MLCNRLYNTLFLDKKARLLYNVYLYIIVFKFLKRSLVADKRLRSGLKAQQAHSPGQRPGLISRRYCALKGQKRLYKRLHANAFAPSLHFIAASYPGRCPGLCARCPCGAYLERLRLFSDSTIMCILTKN